MTLSEHMYCVDIAFKVTERIGQLICIKFGFKLEHASMKSVQMSQKATALGNSWLAALSWQCTGSCITFPAEFLAKHQIPQVTQPPYGPELAPCAFWLFLKLKSPLKGRDFRSLMRFRKIQLGWWRLGELCEVPRCLLWKGLRCHFLCPMFHVSCIFFNKCLYLSHYKAGDLLD